MKKITCLLAVATLLFTSCSSSDDTDNNSNVVLPTKFVQTYPSGQIYGGTVEYDGNKLKKITDIEDNKEYSLYFYTGDLITKIESYYDGNLDYLTTYEYNTNKQLVKEIETDIAAKKVDMLTTYVYNANQTVSEKRIEYSSSNTEYITNKTYTLVNGEISKIVTDDAIETYIYDSKNSPFKNVLGFDKIYELIESYGSKSILIENKREYTYQSTTSNSGRKLKYTYNQAGYPTFGEGEDYYNDNIEETFTYTFEYNQ